MNLFGIESAQQTTPVFKQTGVNRQTPDKTENVEAADLRDTVRKSTNIMAGNFVHAHREESRYVAGIKKGLALQNSFLDQMQAVVSKYRNLVEMSGDPSYAKDAVKAVGSIVDDEVEDTNAEKLEDIREDIEEKADEAVATESQKVLENETSPQDALDESLEEAAPEAQAEAEGKGEQAVTDSEPNAEPVADAPKTDQHSAAAPENDQPSAAAMDAYSDQEAAAQQGPYGGAPVAASIDLMI